MFSTDEVRRAMRLYAVTDSAWLGGRTLAHCVSQALAGGATFVQLREKNASRARLVALAQEIMPLCRDLGIPFVIDDDVEAALACGADGVHVGQSDTAASAARRMLGPDKIVGVSAQTVEQALAAQAAGASYLGVGAMFATSTKTDASLVSLEELARICAAVSIPVVAIGGLNENTIASLADTGVAGAAVVSGIFAAPDIEEATRRLGSCVDDMLRCSR